jgi:hypothetical protein
LIISAQGGWAGCFATVLLTAGFEAVELDFLAVAMADRDIDRRQKTMEIERVERKHR